MAYLSKRREARSGVDCSPPQDSIPDFSRMSEEKLSRGRRQKGALASAISGQKGSHYPLPPLQRLSSHPHLPTLVGHLLISPSGDPGGCMVVVDEASLLEAARQLIELVGVPLGPPLQVRNSRQPATYTATAVNPSSKRSSTTAAERSLRPWVVSPVTV